MNVPTPTHAERARTLVAGIPTGTLCTLAHEPEGYPYGSFVTVAFDNGNPVFLISGLAEHTKNLERDPRASLLVAESGSADPLANGRVTLLGPCTRVEGKGGSARDAFLAAHPNASYYADFRDFGSGGSTWLQFGTLAATGGCPGSIGPTGSPPNRIRSARRPAGIIAHMNADHADALVLYCKAFSKATDTTAATMTGVDRYGFEMSAKTSDGPRPVRLAFATPVSTPEEVRAAMVSMVKDARRLT